MSFLSLHFLFFLPVSCFLYFLVPRKVRWMVLLGASGVFYLSNSVPLSIFLLFTAFTTFWTGKRLGQIRKETDAFLKDWKEGKVHPQETKKEYRAKQDRKKRRQVLLAAGANIGVLCVLKYTGFLFSSLNQAMEALGLTGGLPGVSFLLPLGISFYTLQSVGYLIDVYRGRCEADTNFAKYLLFVSFFPQIVQGPISRYDQLAHQLYEGHSFDYHRVSMGAQLILWGYLKKLVITERLSMITDPIFQEYLNYSGITMLLGAALYGFQVYIDFSGGMDITRGIAQMLGIDMTENFARPYFARSLAEFWRRWHITLGAWMRDYVFYPISLSAAFSRLGKRTRKWFGTQTGKMIPTFLAMFITFLLVGIWHGAEWKYVAYGLWNAAIISSSILLEPFYKRMAEKLHIRTEGAGWKLFQMIRTFFLVSLGRFFSGAVSLESALTMMKSAFTVWNPEIFTDGTLLSFGLGRKDYLFVFILTLFIFAVGIYQERGGRVRETMSKQKLPLRWAFYLGAILILVLFGHYGPGYSAAEFVYQQF